VLDGLWGWCACMGQHLKKRCGSGSGCSGHDTLFNLITIRDACHVGQSTSGQDCLCPMEPCMCSMLMQGHTDDVYGCAW
jgi:hypothetical protein